MTVPLYYPFNKLPYWNQEDQAAATITAGTQGSGTKQLAPYSQDFSSGYDAHGRLTLARRRRILQVSNGNLCDGNTKFPLFLSNVSIDFALSGNTAQSQYTRDYYPHNIVMPSFQLNGQCYDQTSYGELCEFTHAQHRHSLGSSGPLVTYKGHQYQMPLVQLFIKGNVHKTINGGRRGNRGVTFNGRLAPNQTIKGQHEDILCLGYMASMPRQHQTGVYVPQYTMAFTVAFMLQGPYNDNIAQVVEQSSWVSLKTGTDAQKFGTLAQLATNKQDLLWAASHVGNVIKAEG